MILAYVLKIYIPEEFLSIFRAAPLGRDNRSMNCCRPAAKILNPSVDFPQLSTGRQKIYWLLTAAPKIGEIHFILSAQVPTLPTYLLDFLF